MASLFSAVPAPGELTLAHRGKGGSEKLSLVSTNLSGNVDARLEVFLAHQRDFRLESVDVVPVEFTHAPAVRFVGEALVTPTIAATYKIKRVAIRNAGIKYEIGDALRLDVGTLRYALVVSDVTAAGGVVDVQMIGELPGSQAIEEIPASVNHYPIGGAGRDLVLSAVFEFAAIAVTHPGEGCATARFEFASGAQRTVVDGLARVNLKPHHKLAVLKLDPDQMLALNDVRVSTDETILVRSSAEVAVKVIGE